MEFSIQLSAYYPDHDLGGRQLCGCLGEIYDIGKEDHDIFEVIGDCCFGLVTEAVCHRGGQNVQEQLFGFLKALCQCDALLFDGDS